MKKSSDPKIAKIATRIACISILGVQIASGSTHMNGAYANGSDDVHFASTTYNTVAAMSALPVRIGSQTDIQQVSAAMDNPARKGDPSLDPGLGNGMMQAIAQKLYRVSPFTAYLPTRLPDIGWKYTGLHSSVSPDGYEVEAYISPKVQQQEETLQPPEEPAVANKQELFRLTGTKQPVNANQSEQKSLIYQKGNWSFYAEPSMTAEDKNRLNLIYSKLVQYSDPVADSSGEVYVTAAGAQGKGKTGSYAYSAVWSQDSSQYSLQATSLLSLNDFNSLLTSFRPVINLLESADAVILPQTTDIRVQSGKAELFLPQQNKVLKTATTSQIVKGAVYVPLKEVMAAMEGKAQAVQSQKMVYISRQKSSKLWKLDPSSGNVYSGDKKIANYHIIEDHGALLVPTKFLNDLFGVQVTPNTADKTYTLSSSSWFIEQKLPDTSPVVDYNLRVMNLVSPSFQYQNAVLGTESGFSYSLLPPPKGYISQKYSIAEISMQVIPGTNVVELKDSKTLDTLVKQKVTGMMDPGDVPFRYSGYPGYDGLKLNLSLITDGAKAWKGGFAEASRAAELQGKFLEQGFDSLRLDYTYITPDSKQTESETVTIPVKNKSFSYNLKPEKGLGTYIVTLYNPSHSLPKVDKAGIVSYTVVFK